MTARTNFLTTLVSVVLATCIAGIGAWIGSGLFAENRVESLIRAAQVQAQTAAKITSGILDTQLIEAAGIPIILAQEPSIQAALASFGADIEASPLPLAARAALWNAEPGLSAIAKRLEGIVAAFDLNTAYIANAAGDAVAEGHMVGVNPFTGNNYADRKYFQEAKVGLNGRQFAVGRATNLFALFFSSPVIVNGQFVGMVGVNFNLTKLARLIPQENAFVVDENGVIILAPTPDLFMQVMPGSRVNQLSAAELDSRYKRHDFKTVALQEVTGDGHKGLFQWGQTPGPYVMASHEVAKFPLRVYVLSNLSEGIDAIRTERLRWFAIISLAMLLFFTLSGAGASYLVVTRNHQAELLKLNATLDLQANTDALTGLANLRHFMMTANKELSRLARYGGQLSVLMVDIDHFKIVNDTYGHQNGDLVLKNLGRIFKEILRDVDEISRVGGEEFAILLPQTSAEGAVQIAERLRQSIDKSTTPIEHGAPVHFTVSVGVTTLVSGNKADIDVLLEQADKALYEAKHQGRNRVSVWNGDQNAAMPV